MKDYQGNSNKSKEESVKPAKNLEKVVTGQVVVKPKPLGARFKNIFFGGDMAMAREYVIAEVILPALRNLLSEAVAKGTDRLVYGESGVRRRPTTTYSPRVQYNRVSSAILPNQPPVSSLRAVPMERRTQEDVVVASKADADMVAEAMANIVDQYEIVSLADLNELLGLPSSHVDNKWGWTNLNSMVIRQVREGYQISFPPLEEIS